MLGIIRHLGRGEIAARRFRQELKAISTTMMVGAGLTMVGGGILAGLEKTLPAAARFNHELALMNAAGMKQTEIAQATAAAWATSKAVPTTVAAENLAAISE